MTNPLDLTYAAATARVEELRRDADAWRLARTVTDQHGRDVHRSRRLLSAAATTAIAATRARVARLSTRSISQPCGC